MITTITQFSLPAGAPHSAIIEGLNDVAPEFLHLPGLVRKYFLLAEDTSHAGGVYLWESREAAAAFSEGPLRQMIREKFGVEARITYFNTPVIADAALGKVVSD